ncbi:hypothetical protein SAMN05192545_3948 [Maribacter dokdonensis]|uniref:Uncharacterized protein n=1 Tax=Maribacter dokdonensis TaxID=320912 RepID=A0ABY0V0U3_9FLAO|nr:hypothetical protein SAMN05192545_3896 [Maribacter dokdonensis]SDT47762.1 hypothetical protein SAMN05192545_3948 [Maribacter dokdonensis]
MSTIELKKQIEALEINISVLQSNVNNLKKMLKETPTEKNKGRLTRTELNNLITNRKKILTNG